MAYRETTAKFLHVNSSIHVAVAVYSLGSNYGIIFAGMSYNENLDYFIFYATITGYNFIKYAGVAKFYHMKSDKKHAVDSDFLIIVSFCLLGILWHKDWASSTVVLLSSIWAH